MTQPGSAVHQKTSSGWRSSASVPVAWCATTASCTWTAPFGVPGRAAGEVQQRHVLGSVGAISNVSGGRGHESCGARCSVGDVVVAPTEQHVLEVRQLGPDRRDLAPVERRGGHQHRRVAECRGAVAIGSGPNAENSGHTTAPCFSVPSTATYSSGTRPSSANTRSPAATPSAGQDVGEAVRRPRRAPRR